MNPPYQSPSFPGRILKHIQQELRLFQLPWAVCPGKQRYEAMPWGWELIPARLLEANNAEGII